MIQIKRKISFNTKCIYCDVYLENKSVIWQGIHILLDGICPNCNKEFLVDFPIGHGAIYPFVVDLKESKLVGSNLAENWFGKPLLNFILKPSEEKLKIEIEKKKKAKDVVILNCLDFLYGHSLLKLLNADLIIKDTKKNLIIIIPKTLRWMVPKGVCEIWTIDLPFKKTQTYYLDFNLRIHQELKRFNNVYLAEDNSHPLGFNIENFTRTKVHDLAFNNYRISFIWREDRPWFFNDYIVYGLKKIKFMEPLILLQNFKVRTLFYLIKRKLPRARFTIVGIGTKTKFPKWIEDIRFNNPSQAQEKKLCEVYSDSRVVVGVHGSNMLLPSAHAGMVVDLLPDIKVGLIASDVLYQQNIDDPRVLSFNYRFLPISVGIMSLVKTIVSMITQRSEMLRVFKNK